VDALQKIQNAGQSAIYGDNAKASTKQGVFEVKDKLFHLCFPLIFIVFAVMGTIGIGQEASRPAGAPVILEVLNPRGEIEPPPVSGISPRIQSMEGKKIGLYDNGKAGFAEFLNEIEKLLKERYPTITVMRYNGAFDIGDNLARKVASEVDAFIYGSAD
jgi:hypothetical protein